MNRYFLAVMCSVMLLSLCSLTCAGARDDEDDADVSVEPTNDTVEVGETEDDDEDYVADAGALPSLSEVETSLLFLKPYLTVDDTIELPAGKPVEVLISVHNRGGSVYSLTALEGSLRYPMDYNFYMQNFTALDLEDYVLPPDHQGTILYSFVPAESFGSRSFGLVLSVVYQNQESASFVNPVFNKTIPIVEVDDGLDGETFFLYLFLAGLVVLLGILIQQFFMWGKKKAIKSSVGSGASSVLSSTLSRHARRTQSVETGTKSSDDDVDFDWLPKEILQGMKAEKKVTKTKKRKSRKNAAGDGSMSN